MRAGEGGPHGVETDVAAGEIGVERGAAFGQRGFGDLLVPLRGAERCRGRRLGRGWRTARSARRCVASVVARHSEASSRARAGEAPTCSHGVEDDGPAAHDGIGDRRQRRRPRGDRERDIQPLWPRRGVGEPLPFGQRLQGQAQMSAADPFGLHGRGQRARRVVPSPAAWRRGRRASRPSAGDSGRRLPGESRGPARRRGAHRRHGRRQRRCGPPASARPTARRGSPPSPRSSVPVRPRLGRAPGLPDGNRGAPAARRRTRVTRGRDRTPARGCARHVRDWRRRRGFGRGAPGRRPVPISA